MSTKLLDLRVMFPKEKFKAGTPTFTALEVAKLINGVMKKKTHGGARKGAGRKLGITFKEPTVVMRIPLSKVSAVEKLLKKDGLKRFLK